MGRAFFCHAICFACRVFLLGSTPALPFLDVTRLLPLSLIVERPPIRIIARAGASASAEIEA
jgi:hypothetical protein